MEQEISRTLMRFHLRRAFNRYGIEGTEDKIKKIYASCQKLMQLYLNEYYEMIWG